MTSGLLFRDESMKNIIVSILMLFLSPTVMATIKHAPPTFNTEAGKAVFIDFQKADYSLQYDPSKKILTAKSSIIFESFEEGMPVFDMVENPTHFLVDGVKVPTKVISSPDEETWFRIALTTLKPGIHTFQLTSLVTQGVEFLSTGVSSAFWLNDLGDRAFLEAYLPANFEFDQYKITLLIDFKSMSHQKFFTNGFVTQKSDNKFIVEFPETYNSSALYYHTAPIGRFKELNFNFISINGKVVPAVVYSKESSIDLENVKNNVKTMIQNLENFYGPWLHEKIIVHIVNDGGGMEYSGATMTDLGSLNHELTHSYFARGGFMPSNGNAGWIDEALTTWSDSGRKSDPNLDGIMANMADQSPYRRYTDNRAYSIGASFMSYLHFHFLSSGGLTSFLNNLIQNNAFRPMTTEEFKNLMVVYYNEDLTDLFKDHVYKDQIQLPSPIQRPIHIKMTIPEMAKFL